MKILVSACLLGCACRYDGKSVPSDGVTLLLDKHTLIPVCPELLGGLPTPRPSSERVGNRVLRADGTDVTEAYRRGADEVLRLARLYGTTTAILKSKSPACGVGTVYDGTFTRTLTDGDGVLAELLLKNGIRVLTEHDLDELKKE